MAEKTYYYLYPDGTLEEHTTTAEEPHHPEGVTLLTAEEYAGRMAELQQQREQQIAEDAAREDAERRATYEELVASGISPAVASNLSGYTPPPSEPDGEPDTAVVT